MTATLDTTTCASCAANAMETAKVFKHSRRSVTVGVVLACVGLAAMAAAAIWYVVLTTSDAEGPTPQSVAAESKRALTDAGVPDALIAKTLEGNSLERSELATLTDDQRRHVADAWNRVTDTRAHSEIPGSVSGVAAFTVAIPAGAVFLIAIPLLARRRARRCGDCGAIADA